MKTNDIINLLLTHSDCVVHNPFERGYYWYTDKGILNKPTMYPSVRELLESRVNMEKDNLKDILNDNYN
jgi:hypothetical protein